MVLADFFKEQRSCDGWGGGLGTLYFLASEVHWKAILGSLYLDFSRDFLTINFGRKSEAAVGGPGSVAHLGSLVGCSVAQKDGA